MTITTFAIYYITYFHFLKALYTNICNFAFGTDKEMISLNIFCRIGSNRWKKGGESVSLIAEVDVR